jgi:MFS family permease
MSWSKSKQPQAALHPTIKATGVVSFFTDLGSEMIYPILPMFLTQQLHATRFMLGWIEGLAEGFPAIVKLFSGAWADRVRNRKWLVFAGYSLSTVCKPLIGLAQSSGVALVFRLFDRLGKGIRGAPRDALVADFAGKEQRGHAFGYQRSMDHAGAMAGGLAAFALLYWAGLSMKWIIAVSAVPGLLAVLTILFYIREKPDRVPAPIARALNPFRGLKGLPSSYFFYVGGASIFAMANSSDAFLLLRGNEIVNNLALISLVWAALHLVKSVTSLWGGKLSDRIGRIPMILGGWTVYGLIYFGFAHAQTALSVLGLFLGYGIFFGLTEGAARAVVADIVPEGRRGSAFGFWGALEGILTLAASLLTGWLWDRTGGARVPLTVCGCLSLAAALYLIVWSLCRRRHGSA